MAPAGTSSKASVSPRTHIVMIPGFAGFDALGQMEYYAAVTPQFAEWKKLGRPKRRGAVLHYCNSFPTAAVAIRARRLRDYLAKRIARGEFLERDAIALVGHSTGGLDIRQLLCDLVKDYERGQIAYPVDGTHGSPFAVDPGDLLERIQRVVFLSVPQFGTNIADWVRAHSAGRYAVIADLRAAVATSQVPVIDQLQKWLTSSISAMAGLDLFDAMQDALSEARPARVADKMRVLLAQEAASELALYLRYIFSDFDAINDLSAEPFEGKVTSPAHFDTAARRKELKDWTNHNIVARSFASLGPRPFDFDAAHSAPRWELLNPFSYPETTSSTSAKAGTDIVYRTCYRACAAGPFEYPDIGISKPPVLPDENGLEHEIAVWDNDGIVNTASMLWPNLDETVLVNADHMDIVGHYKRVLSADPDSARRYDAYDLLKSGSGLDSRTFARVWNGVFEFCTG